jgi:hypothetical protein
MCKICRVAKEAQDQKTPSTFWLVAPYVLLSLVLIGLLAGYSAFISR